MQSLDILLQEFGRSMDLPDLCFDDEDCCALEFDELAVVLSCRRGRQQLCIYAEVGSLAQPSPEILLALLEANALHRSTGGGALGACRDEEGRTLVVVYSALFDADALSLARLDRALARFVDVAESWKRKVSDWAAGPPGERESNGGAAPGEPRGMRV